MSEALVTQYWMFGVMGVMIVFEFLQQLAA